MKFNEITFYDNPIIKGDFFNSTVTFISAKRFSSEEILKRGNRMDYSRRNELDQLYRNYAKPLYYYLFKLSGSAQLAEDLTQKTFVRATVLLSSYKQEDVRAWLFKVARNAYLDEWRKRKRRKWVPFATIKLFT